MIIVSTWSFLGFGIDLYKYKMGTIDRNVGHAALQVVSGPNKGVYVSWWPTGQWSPDKKGRYALQSDLARDFAEEAWNRRNQMSADYQRFLDALEQISNGGGPDAATAKKMFDMVMDGDSDTRKQVKFRPPSQVFHIPSQADGELFGLDDRAILNWWAFTTKALKKAAATKGKDFTTYYDLMTNNCSDAIILALGAGLGRINEKGEIIKNARVPHDWPEVPDVHTKVMTWNKPDLPTLPPGFGLTPMTPEQGMELQAKITELEKVFITPDLVEKKALETMKAIGEKQTAYKETVKVIPLDKKFEALPKDKSFEELDEKLASAGVPDKQVKAIAKALQDFKDPKTTKAQDTVILAEMLIDLADFAKKNENNDKIKWPVVFEFGNQVHDTIEQLLKENAKEVKADVDKAAKTLWT